MRSRHEEKAIEENPVKIRRVAIVAHLGKPAIAETRDQLVAWLDDRDIGVSEDAPNLVLSLGGDGTMLRAAQVAHGCDAPLLGVNLGRLGYLAEVDAGEMFAALDKIVSGDYQIEERMVLRCEESDGSNQCIGLNEVLVERSSRQRLVRLNVSIGGERLAAFNADGVIVATPTGSTAYALSAGGPIVSPRAQCLVLVPVSAHMIFSRPFVLAPDDIVEVQVDEDSDEAVYACDAAAGVRLAPGDKIVVRRHFRPLMMVRLSGPGFLERLRSKLGLPE
jgi:NAD+ kinase